MIYRSIVALTLFVLFVTCENCWSAVTLVDGHQPTSVIVTADHPTPAAVQGAQDLQMWLKRSSGATIPIRKENEIGPAANAVRILVGDTTQTRSLGIDPDELGLEEIVVKTFPNALVIIGDDQRPDGVKLTGTVSAVNTFAEEGLGVRMLWPGPLGEIVPAKKSIQVGDINIRQKPVLLERSVGNHSFNGVTHDNMDALGWDRDEYKKFADESNLWFRFHRLGKSHTGNYGHAWVWQQLASFRPRCQTPLFVSITCVAFRTSMTGSYFDIVWLKTILLSREKSDNESDLVADCEDRPVNLDNVLHCG